MRVTNLHLLLDKGLKLNNAILKEESVYKDTLMQYNHVDQKFKRLRFIIYKIFNRALIFALLLINQCLIFSFISSRKKTKNISITKF